MRGHNEDVTTISNVLYKIRIVCITQYYIFIVNSDEHLVNNTILKI